MPDETVLGQLRFTRELLPSVPEDLERQRLLRLVTKDCHPDPGPITMYEKPDLFEAFVFDEHVQEREMRRLGALGGRDPTFPPDDVITRALNRLEFGPMTITYGAEYRALLALVPCCTVDVYLRIRYDFYTVRALANGKLEFEGESFPDGDELASFRVGTPVQYCFETWMTHNPRCCDGDPPAVEEQRTEWFENVPIYWPFVDEPNYDESWFEGRGRRWVAKWKTSFGG